MNRVHLVLILSFIAASGGATAATINVAAGSTAIAADGTCSLVEAFENAEADSALHADCTAGSGADDIVLANGATYTLAASNNNEYGPNGLPAIFSAITVEGNNATIQRDGAAGPFRLAY